MSFYLVISTYRRKETADAIINLNEIIAADAAFFENDEGEIKFCLMIFMKEDKSFTFKFNTEEELRKEMENVFQDKKIATEFLISDKTKKAQKERALEQMKRSIEY